MAANTQVSCALSLIISLLIFSGCQACRIWLAATPLRTILGGYIASLLFTTLLTLISNVETMVLGRGVTAGLFPEVTLALTGALATAALIHRVCVTTCVIFSAVALYYMNKLSQKTYAVPATASTGQIHKKKRAN